MIDEIPIPPKARQAATDELLRTDGDVVAAIRAALHAWPGVCITTRFQPDLKNGGQCILPAALLSLPLTKEGQRLEATMKKLRRGVLPLPQEPRT